MERPQYIQPAIKVIQGVLHGKTPPPVKVLSPEAAAALFGSPHDCTCKVCVEACTFKPGYFAPGEAERAATLLGLTLQEFFDQYLGVDWYDKDETIFVLSPALAYMGGGGMFPPDPRGRCIFLDEHNRCKIHAAKPWECRRYHHGLSSEHVDAHHEAVASMWKGHEQQLTDLLGRAPFPTEE